MHGFHGNRLCDSQEWGYTCTYNINHISAATYLRQQHSVPTVKPRQTQAFYPMVRYAYYLIYINGYDDDDDDDDDDDE